MKDGAESNNLRYQGIRSILCESIPDKPWRLLPLTPHFQFGASAERSHHFPSCTFLHIAAGESNICAVVGRVELLTDLILWLC